MQFLEAKEFILEKLNKELPKHLSYHSLEHILDVYDSCLRIGTAEGISDNDMTLLLTAALYHDAGFIIQQNNHEALSCEIAKVDLPQFGYTKEHIEKICGMIMATKLPQTPHNLLEEILADADLDYLGREDFFTIGNRLFDEISFYGMLTPQDWNNIQIRFLESHAYFTQTAINTRKSKKDKHLAWLKNNI
jgi:uncharacterized protein